MERYSIKTLTKKYQNVQKYHLKFIISITKLCQKVEKSGKKWRKMEVKR